MSTNSSYAIRLAKEPFTFSAAHFITYDGDTCERLHGHNYHVAIELSGPMDENHYVRDFVATRNSVAQIVAELDHRVILPTEHPTIRVEPTETEVVVSHAARRWVFPRGDCCLLPIANTTAELLANYLGQRILEALWIGKGSDWQLTVEVDECDGQVGLCRLTVS